MSTVAIFNGFGKYEQTNDGEKGMTLLYAGIPFWFPYDKVTYIPDCTLREVDHRESSADGEEESVLTYKTFRLLGERIAEEILETQIPYTNHSKGLILISTEAAKRKNSYAKAFAGYSEEGTRLLTEVQEVTPTPFEIEEAHRLAQAFKEELVQGYFQSKRERMAGGNGRITPNGLVKVFMEELGIKDIDDVSRQLEGQKAAPGISNEQLVALIQSLTEIRERPSAPPTPKVENKKTEGKITADEAKNLV